MSNMCGQCGFMCDDEIMLNEHQQAGICSIDDYSDDQQGDTYQLEEIDSSDDASKTEVEFELTTKECAINGYGTTYSIRTTDKPYIDPRVFLDDVSNMLEERLKNDVGCYGGIIYWCSLAVSMEKADGTELTSHFTHKRDEIRVPEAARNVILKGYEQIINNIEAFQERGSGWMISKVEHLDIHRGPFQPLTGSSHVPLPVIIRRKKSVLNIKNKDNKCFMWSILAFLHQGFGQRANKVHVYQEFSDQLDFTGIDFPVKITDIDKFEQLNRMSVHVMGYDDEKKVLKPLRRPPTPEYPQLVHLLLYKGHYNLIRSLNGLLYSQNKMTGRKMYCHRCYRYKRTPEELSSHLNHCNIDIPVRMPDESTLKFSDHAKQLKAPIMIYADFECITEKIAGCENKPTRSSTVHKQLHTPCGYGLVKVTGCCDNEPETSDFTIYRGHDCVKKFLEQVIDIGNKHQKMIDNIKPMTNAPTMSSTTTGTCHICGEGFCKGCSLHRDHCHICGNFRGFVHTKCNMKYTMSRDVTVGFHNLKGYDGHLIMEQLGTACKERGLKINCIPKGGENYLSFSVSMKGNLKRKMMTKTKTSKQAKNLTVEATIEHDNTDNTSTYWHLRFIDIYQHLKSPLATLTKNLECHPLTRKELGRLYCGNIDLLTTKGVYPYDYMDSWERFEETTLPSKEHFYSQLHEDGISKEDYDHALVVWKEFGLKNMGDYHDLYLATDVMLLADVFEGFRKTAHQYYGMDMVHYYTLPSFAWAAFLKMTDVELELLTDQVMYEFLESGIRGGVSIINHRHAKANNKNVDGFNANADTSHLLYLDANNLYGWAMIQKLPMSQFKWLEDPDKLNVKTIDPDGEMGYILEVDLEYPARLHNEHNDYPLAPENMVITEDILSPYALEIRKKMNMSKAPMKKLVPNLMNKKNYVVHIRNLQFYLNQGLALTKIHRALQFHQEAFMAEYIMFNTKMRQQAKNNFEKDLFKLMNNSVFGKTMENVRPYRDIELVWEPERFMKLLADPRTQCWSIFNKDLVAVHKQKKTIVLKKPIYIGFSVLDLSKLHMGRFHYEHIKPKYGTNVLLLFSDTDSLLYKINTEDVHKDMQEDTKLYDFSDYPKGHFLYSEENKKVIGKMKDEMAGRSTNEFIGLKAKMYSIQEASGKESIKAKGVNLTAKKKHLKHLTFKQVLENANWTFTSMQNIRSEKHIIYLNK